MAETKDEIEKNLKTQMVVYPTNFYTTEGLLKTFLLSDWDLKKYTPSEFTMQRAYIEKLLNDGFTIYLWLTDQIMSLSKEDLSPLDTDKIVKRIRPEYPERIIAAAMQQIKTTLRPENLHVLGPHWFQVLQPNPVPFAIYASDYAKYGESLIDIIKKHHARGPEVIVNDLFTPDIRYKKCLHHLQRTLQLETITDYRKIGFFREGYQKTKEFDTLNEDMFKNVTRVEGNNPLAEISVQDFLDKGLNRFNLKKLGISNTSDKSAISLLKTPGLNIQTLLLSCSYEDSLEDVIRIVKQNRNTCQNLENIKLWHIYEDTTIEVLNAFLRILPRNIKTISFEEKPLQLRDLTFKLSEDLHLSSINFTLSRLNKSHLQTINDRFPFYHLLWMKAYDYRNIAEFLENNIELFKYLRIFTEHTDMPWLTTKSIIEIAATNLQQIIITNKIIDTRCNDFPHLPCLRELTLYECALSIQGLQTLLKKTPFIITLVLDRAQKIKLSDLKKIRDEFPNLSITHNDEEYLDCAVQHELNSTNNIAITQALIAKLTEQSKQKTPNTPKVSEETKEKETQKVAYPANFYTAEDLPKTLLLADWDLKKYTPTGFKTQRLYIEKLLDDGFTIYLWLTDQIMPLSRDNLFLLEVDSILKRIRPEYPERIITTAIRQIKTTLTPENLHVLGPHWFHLRPNPPPFPIYASDYAKYGDTLIDIIKKHHAFGPQIIIDDKLTPDEHYTNCLIHLQETLLMGKVIDYRKMVYFDDEDNTIETFSTFNQDTLNNVTYFHANSTYCKINYFLDIGLNPLNLRTLGITDSTEASENSLLKTPGLNIKTLLLDCDLKSLKDAIEFFKQNPNIYQNLENITLLKLPEDTSISDLNEFLKVAPKTIKTLILNDPLKLSDLTFDLRKHRQLSTIDISLSDLTKNHLQTLAQSPVYHLKNMTSYNYQNIAECLEKNMNIVKYLEIFIARFGMPWLTTINIITSASTYLQQIIITHTICDSNSKDFPYLPCLKDCTLLQCDLNAQGLLDLLKKMPFIKRLTLRNLTQINEDDIAQIKAVHPALNIDPIVKRKNPNTQKAPEDTTEKSQVKDQSQTQKTNRKPESMPKEKKNKENKEANILFVEMLQETLKNLKSMSTKNQNLNEEKDALKTNVLKSITEITTILSLRIQSSYQKQYLSDLAISDETLDECNKIYESIKQLEDELKILATDYSTLCKGLQGEGAAGALTDTEKLALEKQYSEFSKVREALSGEMNELKKTTLEDASVFLMTLHQQILEKDAELSNEKKALKNLKSAIEARKKLVDQYKPSKKKEVVDDKDEKEINNNLEVLKQKLAIQPPQTQVPTTPAAIQTPTPVRPRIEVFPVPRQTTQTSPEQPRELTRDERQVLRVAALEKKAKDTKMAKEKAAIEAEKAAVEKAGGFPLQERVNNNSPKTDIKKPDLSHIQSPLFKMHLEQLNIIINILKREHNWSLETQFALLGSIAQVSELSKEEFKDLDIKRIASRLRNCIYKKHEEVLTEIGDNEPFEPLLSMAEAWYTFLITKQTASLKDAEAVLKAVNSPEVKKIYYLEQEFKFDVEKSRQYIIKMQVYWKLRRKPQKSEHAQIDAAAVDFCWAVTGAELPPLIKEADKGNPQAIEALNEFPTLIPFSKLIQELGYDSRHRSERSNNLTVLMRELELFEARNKQALIFSNGPIPKGQKPKEQKEDSEEIPNITIRHLVQSLHTGATDGFIGLLDGVNVHTKTSDGYTLLLAASKNLDTPIEVIKKLLELGANPNDTFTLVQSPNDETKIYYNDFSCLDFAALNGRADILQLFIANEKQPIETQIWKNAKEMYARFKNNENPELVSLFEQALPTRKLQCK